MESGYERQIKRFKAIGRIVAKRPARMLPVSLFHSIQSIFGRFTKR